MNYRHIRTVGNASTFANTANIAETLQISNVVNDAKSASFSLPIARSTIIFSSPKAEQQEGCTDGCGPRATITDSVRIELSHKQGSTTKVLEQLEQLTDWLKANPTFVDGFNPPAAADITLPVA